VASLTSALRSTPDPVRSALLFLDDLPYHFSGEGLERLTATLAAFKACKDSGYVVATARHDQLTAEHHRWLAQQGFHILELPDLDAGQTGRLVDSAAGLFGLQLDDAGRQELVVHNDGTPHLPFSTLNLLREQGQTQVAHHDLHRVHQQTVISGWAATRRYIVERYPVAAFVLDALAHFHAADVPTSPVLVLAYAAHRWRHQQRFAWRRWAALHGALDYLAHFNVHVARDAITYPEEVVEGVIDPAAARRQVGTFLMRHRRYCHNRWLRRFYRRAEAQYWALFALAYYYQQCQEHAEAIRYYSAALRVIPRYWSYNNRGNARRHQGDLDGAIADYNQAIALQPDYAATYDNRGIARSGQGDLDGAIADFNQAIALQPDNAAAYNNRGIARSGQGDLDGAIADFNQAIILQPGNATGYYNRGIARSDRGDLDGAIADYDQAIILQPGNAAAYYNRGLTRSGQGDLDGAIADYDQAIILRPDDTAIYYSQSLTRSGQGDLDGAIADYDQTIILRPDDTAIYYNRGLARSGRGDLDGAIADYNQAIALHPDNYLSWLGLAGTARQLSDEPNWQMALERARPLLDTRDLYNAACFESVAGNIEKALTLLVQAVAQDQCDHAWARQDPNLQWLHHNPQFWEIVGKPTPAPEVQDSPGAGEITA
jgi:tetratricopeptide (TPR) repeat protein